MEYIIFGAGNDGRRALRFLGSRVRYYCDNGLAGQEFEGRPILSFNEMLNRYKLGESIIVIASSKYQAEMEYLLRAHRVERYFIFSDEAWENQRWQYWPAYALYGNIQYMSYTDILMYNRIEQYRHIAVSSVNASLPYLLAEIAFQCGDWCVDYILTEDDVLPMQYMGIPVVHKESIIGKVDCLVINARRRDTRIHDELPDNPGFNIVDLYNIWDFIPVYKHSDLMRFKDIHKGQRCFIIGNGPSLRIEDLNTLHENNVICFAVNMIYRAYTRTRWRPRYLCVSDDTVVPFVDKEVDKRESVIFFSDSYHFNGRRKESDINFVHVIGEDYGNNMPSFSSDIIRGVFLGYTVVYDIAIQLAAYMGFKEIYLLGTDCTGDGKISKEGNHFIKNYASQELQKEQDKENKKAEWDMVMRAYRKAELYSRQHGFRIYNATRGGALEEFERVNFDKLF